MAGAFYAKYLLQGDTFIAQRAVHDLATRTVTLYAVSPPAIAAWQPGAEVNYGACSPVTGLRGRRFGRS